MDCNLVTTSGLLEANGTKRNAWMAGALNVVFANVAGSGLERVSLLKTLHPARSVWRDDRIVQQQGAASFLSWNYFGISEMLTIVSSLVATAVVRAAHRRWQINYEHRELCCVAAGAAIGSFVAHPLHLISVRRGAHRGERSLSTYDVCVSIERSARAESELGGGGAAYAWALLGGFWLAAPEHAIGAALERVLTLGALPALFHWLGAAARARLGDDALPDALGAPMVRSIGVALLSAAICFPLRGWIRTRIVTGIPVVPFLRNIRKFARRRACDHPLGWASLLSHGLSYQLVATSLVTSSLFLLHKYSRL
jgi:hypothetical protein